VHIQRLDALPHSFHARGDDQLDIKRVKEVHERDERALRALCICCVVFPLLMPEHAVLGFAECP